MVVSEFHNLILQTVEVGFRDEEGIVHTHQKFRTEDIPPMFVLSAPKLKRR